MNSIDKERDHGLDTAKAALIFLVVFGHVIEGGTHHAVVAIYNVIYMFHMPAFVFLAGWFSTGSHAGIRPRIKRYLVLYLKWSVVYAVLGYSLNGKINHPLTPYWLLWFLVSVACFHALLGLWAKYFSWRFVFAMALVALVAGAVDPVGYVLGASRTIYFFPFFVAGYLSACNWAAIRKRLAHISPAVLFVLIAFVAAASFAQSGVFPRGLLYASYSYARLGLSIADGVLARAMLMATSGAWIFVLLATLSRLEIPVSPPAGRHTLAVYLLHGVLVLLARNAGLLAVDGIPLLMIAALASLAVVLILGNDRVSEGLRRMRLT